MALTEQYLADCGFRVTGGVGQSGIGLPKCHADWLHPWKIDIESRQIMWFGSWVEVGLGI
jgi:hypothetical protein